MPLILLEFIESDEKMQYNIFGDCMIGLRNPYISVDYSGRPSFGGDQRCCGGKVLQRCGCGVVAALDLLLYLDRWHSDVHIPEFANLCSSSPLPQPAYEQALDRLRQAYFPLFYPFGMNGLALSLGINLFFKRHALPYKARWSVPKAELWQRIGAMLERDLPVIMAVGPNFPRFWQKKGTNFFRLSPEGRYVPSVSVRAHFVTATGLDAEWVELSSWGSKYYMSRTEFMRYTRECSNSLLCSILHIEHEQADGV